MSKKKKIIDAIYALSPMQQGMLFHTLYDAGAGVYVEQTSLTLQGDLVVVGNMAGNLAAHGRNQHAHVLAPRHPAAGWAHTWIVIWRAPMGSPWIWRKATRN